MDTHVFLMRHAAHDSGILSSAGLTATRGVAGRLGEWLDGRNLEINVHVTGSREVQETAKVLVSATRRELRQMAPADTPSQDPFPRPPAPIGDSLPAGTPTDRVSLGAYRTDPTAVDALGTWLRGDGTGKGTRPPNVAPLLVGNDPLIGWLAGELVGRAVPVARGELICLAQTPGQTRWRVAWTLAPGDGDQAVPIRDKVKSKMNTAGALGSIVTGLLVFLLTDGLAGTSSIYAWLAFVAMATSAALYFSALFLYDSLLMPERFWGSRFRPPAKPGKSATSAGSAKPAISAALLARIRHGRPGLRRPPSSTARILQQAMVHIWHWIFLPATLWAAAGVLLLILQAARPVDPTADALQPGLGVAVLALLWTGTVAAWVLANRPTLGASD